MKHSYKAAAVVAAMLGLGATGMALAHSGSMGTGMGGGMMGGMRPGMMHGGFAGGTQSQQLMTPEERSAFHEKMRNAKTPEERQKLAEANRAEIEKRAKDKGIALAE